MNRLIKMLRHFLMDAANKNILKGVEEYSDEDLKFFLEMALDDWNTTPPPIPFATIENHISPRLLIYGAALIAMQSSGILQIRNSLNGYSDGGLHIPIMEKGPAYNNQAMILQQQYERQKLQLKKSQNIRRGWGNASSSEWVWEWGTLR